MRKFPILCAVAVCIGIASTNASAQEIGVYVGPSYGYGPYYEQDYYYSYGPRVTYGPRAYDYSRRVDDIGVEAEFGTTDYWVDRETNKN
jgi:hypothetical protein